MSVIGGVHKSVKTSLSELSKVKRAGGVAPLADSVTIGWKRVQVGSKYVNLSKIFQGLPENLCLEAAENELKYAKLSKERRKIGDLYKEAKKERELIVEKYGFSSKKVKKLLKNFEKTLLIYEKNFLKVYYKRLEHLQLARKARFHLGELLPQDFERPKFLYHLTTEENYKKIIASGGIQPYKESASGLKGIWSVELNNFQKDWSKVSRIEDFLGGKHEFSTFQRLLHHVGQKNSHLSGFEGRDKNLVLMQLKIKPEHKLAIRENHFLDSEQDPIKFLNSLRPLDEVSVKKLKGLTPEYIIHDEIPLEDIQIFSKKVNQEFQMPSLRFRSPKMMPYDFFNPNLINPAMAEEVKGSLGFDLAKANSCFSQAEPRPNLFEVF